MATVDTLTIKPADLKLRLKVRGLKAMSLRCQIAGWIMRLAGVVSGFPLAVETDDESRIELLPEKDWKIDRRVGCVYVSTHCTVTPSGERWRNWERVRYPD